MVFFLAPVAAAGYILYQKKKKEEEEEKERERLSGLSKDSHEEMQDGQHHDNQSCRSICSYENPLFASPIESDGKESPSIDDSCMVIPATKTKVMEAATSVPEILQTKRSNTDGHVQRKASKIALDLETRVKAVTNSLAEKFQAFCDDWEKDIHDARSRTTVP
jgi:hypothetical protein